MSQGRTQDRYDRVVAVVQENAASLLRLARRHSLCADDAQDAYQRALEIYLQRLDRIDDATAGAWLRTVVKHEAMAIRETRHKLVGDVDLDAWMSDSEGGEERTAAFDRMTRAAEALQMCRRDEVTAMMLKAEGRSYSEISSITGFSSTKVNRCLSEGRRRFLDRYAAIERGEECERVAPVLSAIVDGEAGEDAMRAVRPHLRNCPSCRATLRELQESTVALHAVAPVGLVAGERLGLFGRLWELFYGSAHHAAFKLQTLVEGAVSTKGAAVAASAAAVAGGSVVAADRVAERPQPAERRVHVVATPTATPAATPTATPTPAATSEPRPEPTSQRAAATPAATPAPAPAETREFDFESARPAAARPAPTAAPTQKAAEPSQDFGFER